MLNNYHSLPGKATSLWLDTTTETNYPSLQSGLMVDVAIIDREYVQPDEDEVVEQMVKITLDQMHTEDGRRLRVQHAKATGCVTAKFQISADLPEDLRHGVFREPGRTFDAIARFSNSQGTLEPDGVGAARGLAIKLLDVPGDRAIQDDSDRTQDFLMVDHPVFLFPDPKAYLDIMRRKNVPLIGSLVAGAHFALQESIHGQKSV